MTTTLPPDRSSTGTKDSLDREALHEKYRRERDKRLRPDGANQYIEPAGKFANLVEVLTQIGERTTLGADSPDLAELYERFARCSGPHLLKRMKAIGAWPGESGEA